MAVPFTGPRFGHEEWVLWKRIKGITNLERRLVGVFDRTVSYTVRSCNSVPHTSNRDDSIVAKVVIRSLPSTVREDPVDRDPERGLTYLLFLHLSCTFISYHLSISTTPHRRWRTWRLTRLPLPGPTLIFPSRKGVFMRDPLN